VTIPTSGAICAPESAAHSRRRTPARWVLQDGFATGKVPSHRDAGLRTALVYRVVPSKGKVCPIGVGEITLFLSVNDRRRNIIALHDLEAQHSFKTISQAGGCEPVIGNFS
jgi:hypothetical protein